VVLAENYTRLCTINVDLSQLPVSTRPKTKGRGVYYRLDYEIVLLFGLTELEARVAWKQKQGKKVLRPFRFESACKALTASYKPHCLQDVEKR
jgi:hypothetical protein